LGQTTYSVTVRRLRATAVAVKKAISVTYSECMSVAYVIQHAKRMRHIVICGLSGSTTLFHIISKPARFSGKEGGWGEGIEHKMRAWILSTTFVWNISHSTKKSAKYYHKCKLHQSTCKVAINLPSQCPNALECISRTL
jgi:hypothetical protein